jgi:hypothetical protein
MNRILRVNDNYKVLVTPTYTTNPSFELMIGNWTDEKLVNYKVYTFNNLQDAMDLAFNYPPIDWNKLITIHKDNYNKITHRIHDQLQSGNFIVEVDSHLMNPTELKETMFKRVEKYGKRFNLLYNANDIICINIINQWTNNLIEISNVLKNDTFLRIKNVIKTPTHIKLIGLTDFGTPYEICLWTSLISQWARWILKNNLNPYLYMDNLNKLIQEQQIIDKNDVMIR